jgi:hypothetical protein
VKKHQGLTKVELFKPSMKLGYTAWVSVPPLDYKEELPYLAAVNNGLANTPANVKGVTMTSVPDGWYAVATHTPWGYPSLVMGGSPT